VLTLAFVAVIARLVVVQGVAAGPYVALGLSERIHTVELPAGRGSILDRNGNELAMSVPQSTVWADPQLVTAPAQEAEALAPVLGLDRQTIMTRLTQPGEFAYVDRTVDDETASQVAALKLPGINMLDEPKRFDPDGTLAASLIGQVGTDDQGLSGVEYEYDSELSGHGGKLVSEDDPAGEPIAGGIQRLTPATKGSDLTLTIDRSLQYEVEQDLSREITATDANGGMAVVMDTKTGEVLAMASLVASGDGSTVVPAPSNSVVTTVYEPGSVQKLITVAAGLQEGVITPGEVFTVPDRVEVAGSSFSDDTPHPLEHWTATDILTASSDVGALTIGRMVGKAALNSYLHRFGEGSETALQFPGESAGLLLKPEDWSGTTIATVSFGQGIAATAMQLAAAYNAIANGGLYVAPKLVLATTNPLGQTVPTPPSATHRIVSATVAREMTAMLTEVTRGGTGTEAAIDGYQVAGKTGTARVNEEGRSGYEAGEDIASFAGFVPATDPAFTALVVIDEPKTEYGGLAAAPVFHDIATYALRELQVPPPPADPDLFDGVPHAQPSAATAADAAGVPVASAGTSSGGLINPPAPAPEPAAAPPSVWSGSAGLGPAGAGAPVQTPAQTPTQTTTPTTIEVAAGPRPGGWPVSDPPGDDPSADSLTAPLPPRWTASATP